MYLQVAHNVDDVIECLQKYENTSEMFYEVRSLDWHTLSKAEAAARTIYLNKTCFNGLYRVNRNGQFNTPFGKYKNPKICDTDALRLASEALKKLIFFAVIIFLFLNITLSQAILYFGSTLSPHLRKLGFQEIYKRTIL